MTVSVPVFRRVRRGRRLVKKEIFTVVFTCVRSQFFERGRGLRVEIIGRVRRMKVRKRLEERTREDEYIAAAWICTKSI